MIQPIELLRSLSFQGDYDASASARQRYATDASVYEELPQMICWPKNADDIRKLVQVAQSCQLPITMRGAGTSLAGQAIGKGIIVDTTRYMRQIIEIDVERQQVTVQPGVVLDELNAALKPYGLWLPIDTSTANRCVLGGVIGNNSCGAYSVAYGTPRDYIVSIDTILTDEQKHQFKALDQQALQEKLKDNGLIGKIYRYLANITQSHREAVLAAYPDTSIIRRNTGYALDHIVTQTGWQGDGEVNLAPLVCGSEGTLALITTATFRLAKLPAYRCLVVVQFNDVFAALDATTQLLTVEPMAIELIDAPTLAGTQGHAGYDRYRFWLAGEPEAVQVIELAAQTEAALAQKVKQTLAIASNLPQAYDVRAIDGQDMAAVWHIRKAGLGLLMGKVGKKKAVAVIEDAAVPVAHLSAFIADIRQLMASLSVTCIYYGHASVGLIHLRPELDLSQEKDRQLFVYIAQQVSTLVKHYQGALSGEHGDGRLRAPFLREQLGAVVYQYCVDLKRLFDPDNLFNPGRIIGELPIDSDWRQPINDTFITTAMDWGVDAGFAASIEKCNGAGVCRQSIGAMCPSYQVSLDDQHSTRGRANLLRFALQSPQPQHALTQQALSQALDTCLSCKACKSECPASVDMSRLKSEVLYQQHQQRRLTAFERLLKNYHRLLPWLNRSRHLVRLLNKFNPSWRQIPQADTADVYTWWQRSGILFNPSTSNVVVVLVDIYSRYLHTRQIQASIRVLQALGYAVQPIWLTASARLYTSHGFLLEAQHLLAQTLTRYEQQLQTTVAIVGIEPAELLVWRDDGLALLKGEQKERLVALQAKLFLFEEAMLHLQPQKESWQWPQLNIQAWLQVHCHQRSLAGVQTAQAALTLIGVDVQLLSDGCCGMSGSFGYRHVEMSKRIAEKQLLPRLRQQTKPVIIAAGSSCQQQMIDFAQQHAVHPAILFAQALDL